MPIIQSLPERAVREQFLVGYLELLKNRDHREIGLRRLAKKVGVSPSAIYRYFPSKDALLDEIALLGMRELGRAIKEVDQRSNCEDKNLQLKLNAYVDWAMTHPRWYQTMFSRLNDTKPKPKFAEALRETQTSFYAPTSEPPSASLWLWSISVWCTAHGMAELNLSGSLKLSRTELAAAFNLCLSSAPPASA